MNYYLYYLFVFLSLVYLLYKNKGKTYLIFIILIFFNGFFAFLGKEIWNIYKIYLFGLSLVFIWKYSLLSIPETKFIKFSFVIFSATFITTAFLSGDYFFIVFSQYSKYFIPFILFLFLYLYHDDEWFRIKTSKLIYQLLIFQIILTVLKFFIIGFEESIVGSISEKGGATATSLPILGFMAFWLKKEGKIKGADWVFVIGLIFIGLVSLKRAIWFVMPIIIGLFMLYIPGKKISVRLMLLSIIMVPLIFYIGVRLSPTLNKENRIWGNFNLEFVINYTKKYNLGDENSEKRTGRANAAEYILDKISTNNITRTEWFGYGLRKIYATDYNEYKELDLDITNKGSATGVYQTMVANGFLGIFATLLFIISLLLKTENKRIRNVLLGFIFWEYFYYTGIVIRDPALSFLLIYLIVFSDRVKKDIAVFQPTERKMSQINYVWKKNSMY